MTFENIVNKLELPVLHIFNDDRIIATGFLIEDAVLSFDDDKTSVISYPDTGVFVLFENSHAELQDKKYERYVDSSGNTNREIVFQSKNAAAKFVLGSRGRSNNWE